MTDEERKARHRAAHAKWRAKNIERERIRSQAYRETHRAETRAQQSAYRLEHGDRIKAARAKWCAAHRAEIRAQAKARREARAAEMRAADRAYRRDNPEKVRKTKLKYRAANSEKVRRYKQSYNSRNRAMNTATHRAWARANRGAVNATTAKRWALRLKATPAWADLDAIQAIYNKAARLTQETGVRWEVDHVIPLQNVLVCGLHVEANLQLLTKADNIRKLNRFTPHGATP